MTFIWHDKYTLDAINARGKNTLNEWLGIEITEIGDDYLQGRMPVDHRTLQPMGIMHGGASCALAESLGSIGAGLVINPNTHFPVGLSIYTSHIKSIKEGWVIGTAMPLHIGRSTHIWNIAIKNKDEQLISDTRLTVAILDRNPDKKV